MINRPIIGIVDRVDSIIQDKLSEKGYDIKVFSEEDTLSSATWIREMKAIVIRSKRLDSSFFEMAPKLKCVVRIGSGLENVDLIEAQKRGIFVSTTAKKTAPAVAELCIGMLVAIDRGLILHNQSGSIGIWTKGEFRQAKGLIGFRLGIYGFGNIGIALAQRAISLGMKVSIVQNNNKGEVRSAKQLELIESLSISLLPSSVPIDDCI